MFTEKQRITRLRASFLAATSALALMSAPVVYAQDEAAKPADDAVLEEVIVTGFRSSLADALSNKRNSNLILESISAEDMGKFPDQNIAESLQRLSGVQIDRENGQGTKVRIRGLDQNVTVLNGEVFLTGLEIFKLGEGAFQRDNSLEGIPAELLGGVDVYKSPNASLVEGGLGGIINLKTRNPLSLKDGLTVAGNMRMSKGSNIDGWTPTGAVAVGYNDGDRLGVIATFSYDKQNVHSDILAGRVRGNWAFAGGRPDAAVVPENYFAPEFRYTTDQDSVRERWGASIGVNYRVTDSIELEANWFHSDLSIATKEASIKYPQGGANDTPGLDITKPYSIDSNGVLLNGTFTANAAEVISFVQDTETKANNYQLGLSYDNGGRLRGSIRGAYAKAKLNSAYTNVDVRYTQYSVPTADAASPTGYSHQAANPGAPANFQYTYNNNDGVLPSFTLSDVPDLFNNPNYGFFKSHWAFDNAGDLENYSARADVEYDPEFISSSNVTLSAGTRFASREIAFEQARYLADYHGKGEVDGVDFGQNWTGFGYFQDGAIGFKSCEIPGQGPNGCDNRFGNSPPLITPFETFTSNADRVETINGFWGSGNAGTDTILVQDRDQVAGGVDYLQSLYPDTPFKRFVDPLNSFRVKEKTLSGYVMADIGGADDNYHVNVGARIVKTELTVDQGVAPADPTYWGTDSWNGVLRGADQSSNSRSYTDILPSANAVFDVTEEDKVRVSVARVVARQNLFQLGQGFETNFVRNADDLFQFTNGSAGNPDLDPFRASQIDISYEHYIGDEGLVSITGFWKEVDSFVLSRTAPEFVMDQTGGSMGPVTRPVNGAGGRIRGIELSGQYVFDIGVGFIANYTFSASTSENFNDLQSDLPMPGVSKHSANAQVYYQHDLFEARMSYSWRNKSYDSNFGFTDGSGATSVSRSYGIWNRAYGQLDAQVVVHVMENFDLTAEAVNITKKAQSQYLHFENLPFSYGSGARRIMLGGRVRF